MKYHRILALVLALLLLAGCSASSDANGEAMDLSRLEETSASYAVTDLEKLTGEASVSDYSQFNAKLIRTVRLDAQTKDYDSLMASLEARITELGGYVESRQAYNGSEYYGRSNRSCTMTVRVPAEKLSEFVTHVNENANVISTQETVEDVTLQYVDVESRIAALETEQTRLMELLETATDLSAILEIESRLSDVNYELERYGSQLRGYDNLVSYATVHLEINEVKELTPVEEPTVWERIRRGFGNTMDNICDTAVELFVWVTVNSPWLLILACVVTPLVILRRRRGKKKKTPKTPPANDERAQ